jgi:endoglucanase
VDQAGYLPNAPKIAAVVSTRTAQEFSIVDTGTGRTVFKSMASAAAKDADSNDNVQLLDFTNVSKPGKYRIDAANIGQSFEFPIGPDVYKRPFYLAMRSFYGQRCGTAVDLGPEFPGYRYEACHLKGAYHESSGKSGERTSAKGWHDAGDYGRYIVNSGITTGTLLWTWELYGAKLRNLRLDIPESTNKTPDILDEIRWNLEWMLTMQDTDGGVWHKQTTERFCGFVMPHADSMTSVVIGTGREPFKGTCATAGFAAVMAIAGRVYKPFDPAFSGRCLRAARQAWTWAERNPKVLFRNPPGVNTGAYGDGNCGDELLWAAAELWRTTAEKPFSDYFVANSADQPEGPASWANVAPLALWAYALDGRGDKNTTASIRRQTLSAADAIVERTASHAYRHSMQRKDYVWGSNSVAANYGVQLLVANALDAKPVYVQSALDNLHYLLGRNPFSLSWVTQVGLNVFKHPHHRPSGADRNAEPWPGLLAGGPNGRKQDPAMQRLADLPPARMYVDDQESYASNETAINWNAPLVFLLAGLM